ncbi:hypothetical protein A0H81_09334 [Grifola frondosa]|uniref:F-box domain-containing protein n=1 Tax=Grifola frondosa TaxID=5627 RepID=A0A1C7M1W0_GRIFR|nr:hypothetical protein A0H81_09334 [Grifola frondosa]
MGLGREGRLAQLVNMHVDIFFEIVVKLEPIDVLHLSRLSKKFRSTLMSKPAEYVWKAARLNIPDFPDCPPNLPEPRYAALIFGRHCDTCGVGSASKVDYALRASYSVKQGKTLKTEQYKNVDDQIFKLLPIAEPECHDDNEHDAQDFYYKPEFERIADQYMALRPDEEGFPRFVEEHKTIATMRHQHNKQLLDWIQRRHTSCSQQFAVGIPSRDVLER